MSERARYLVGFASTTVVPQAAVEKVDAFVERVPDVQCIRKLKTGQCVLEMSAEEVEDLLRENPELVVEPDDEIELFGPMPNLPPVLDNDAELSLAVQVTDEADKPISGVTVFAVGEGTTYRGATNRNGNATLRVFEPCLQHVIASPAGKFWSAFQGDVVVAGETKLSFKLEALPLEGDGWGRQALGVDQLDGAFSGSGVKIAVIDSGVAEHEDLETAGGFNTLDGQDPAAWNVDEKGHGTHCAGIVAARRDDRGVTGVAPAAEVYSLKVFPGGRVSDLVEAVNWCIDNYVDVVSMSLGMRARSYQLEAVLSEAYDRGITAIAAAGNDGGAIAFPAAFDTVVAVTAVGKAGTFPDNSAHALKVGEHASHDGEFFAANFTNSGAEADVCAPGVAITSTIVGGYASWDGTSMACPFVTGLAALILEAYPEVRTGDGWQPYTLRRILADSAVDLGLPRHVQGAGLPNAVTALEPACLERAHEAGYAAAYRAELEATLERAGEYAQQVEEALRKLDVAPE